MGKNTRRIALGLAAASAALMSAAAPAGAESVTLDNGLVLDYSGYVRQWLSANLSEMPDTVAKDRGRLSQARSQVRLDGGVTGSNFKLHGSGRAVKEFRTGWQHDLKGQGASAGHDMTDYYDRAEIRELWAETSLDRITLRVGKQQIVWGETDFFTASDMVHGFDYSWRAMLETENEELRKPLWLVSTVVKVPEVKGEVQGFVRPGLDRGRDLGNSYDTWGGRWSPQPYRGYYRDGVVSYDADHPDGDKSDPTYGLRWRGDAGNVNYSFLYLRTFRPDPIVNVASNPTGHTPGGQVGADYHPVINAYGVTASGYVAPLDAVLSTEITYIPDMPYNYDNRGGNGLYPLAAVTAGQILRTDAGVKNADLVRAMIRSDFNVDLRRFLFTDKTSFLSFQVFDSWLPGLDKRDNLLYWPGFQTKLKQHGVTATGVLQLNYFHDTVNPSLATGWDVSYGGAFVIPAVDFVLGDRFRLRAEADLFLAKGGQSGTGDSSRDVGFISFFQHNSQFVLRGTYQF